MDLKEAKEFDNNIYAVRHPWELARFEVVYSLMCKHFSFMQKRDPIILDIGCGDSFFLGSLSQRLPASKLIGVDTKLDQLAVARYSKQYPNVTLYDSLNDVEIKDEFVDIILLLDVLEHVEDDKSILGNIVQSKMMNNNTLFFITVPAFQFLFSAHDKWLGHYRRYDLKSSSTTAEQLGLKIIDKGYFFFSLLILRIMINFLEQLADYPFSSKRASDWKAHPLLTGFVKAILCLDYMTTSFINRIGLKILGLSCYVICKKYKHEKDNKAYK